MPRGTKFTVRDLFWLVLVAALALGWAIDRDRLRVNYNTHLNEVRRGPFREGELTRALESAGYVIRWNEETRELTLSKPK